MLSSGINGNKWKAKDKVTTNDIRPFADVSKMEEELCFCQELQRLSNSSSGKTNMLSHCNQVPTGTPYLSKNNTKITDDSEKKDFFSEITLY